MDVFITLLQILLTRKGLSRECRVLNIFRLWRLIRLFNSLVNVEKEEHDKTKIELEKLASDLKSSELEKENLRSEVTRVKEAHSSVESMLQTYKEEVDTLNEALRIAAMDIAEVAQGDDSLADDEEDDEFDDHDDDDDISKLTHNENDDEGTKNDDSYYSALAGEKNNITNRKKTSKEELMRAVLRDSASQNESKTDVSMTTFVVHEDGTFDQK
eukprot:CAMPEP_0170094910 /NCGR_PEP_ID=MMETSP0019_2-20121128/27590_1 /TAXON_ID=98059 /ORGANISM="Dinobryon sp., Strain UTEXLB2267" /LENGTH=213 /DNA_ID=CAMNT_0010316437 /DNA_START=215 /DNA_END=856 /DNA_ORIENTATION=-